MSPDQVRELLELAENPVAVPECVDEDEDHYAWLGDWGEACVPELIAALCRSWLNQQETKK